MKEKPSEPGGEGHVDSYWDRMSASEQAEELEHAKYRIRWRIRQVLAEIERSPSALREKSMLANELQRIRALIEDS
jgi:hypothetical protein